MQRWEMDGLTVTLNEGQFDVEGIERLPPGWYKIDLDHDRDGPRLSVHDLGVPEPRDRSMAADWRVSSWTHSGHDSTSRPSSSLSR